MNQNQPNIVMISCDHLRADFLGCSGHPTIQTPTIDHLARRGVNFTQAYSGTPICIPARATIMTGLEGHSLGLTKYQEGYELPVRETLPRTLSENGYQTTAVGKMHFYPWRCHYGFEQMQLCEEGRIYNKYQKHDDYEEWLASEGYKGQAFGHGMNVHDYSVTPWHLDNYLHPTEWIGKQTCKEIKRRDFTRPLFLWASFTAPHPPLIPLMNDLYMYEKDEIAEPVIGDWTSQQPTLHQMNQIRFGGKQKNRKQIDLAHRAFYAMVTQIDRQINNIIGTIIEEGLLDNTWFIFTSDHGDNLGDHNLWGKSNFLKGSCNIPLIITPPVNQDSINEVLGSDWIPGTQNNSVVGLQDLLPTILDISNTNIPENLDGTSLLPLVKNPSESVREDILGEFGSIGKRTLMLTDGVWKYIWYEEDGYELLFNIENDPNEKLNLSSREPHILNQWQSKLIQVLSSRENDPAVEEGKLKAASPGKTLTKMDEKFILQNYLPYHTPGGFH